MKTIARLKAIRPTGNVADLIDRAPPVLDSIRAEGIDLAGMRIRKLLRDER